MLKKLSHYYSLSSFLDFSFSSTFFLFYPPLFPFSPSLFYLPHCSVCFSTCFVSLSLSLPSTFSVSLPPLFISLSSYLTAPSLLFPLLPSLPSSLSLLRYHPLETWPYLSHHQGEGQKKTLQCHRAKKWMSGDQVK